MVELKNPLAWAHVDFETKKPEIMLCIAPLGTSGFTGGRTYKVWGVDDKWCYLWNGAGNYVKAHKGWFVSLDREGYCQL